MRMFKEVLVGKKFRGVEGVGLGEGLVELWS
jgi:hypothetical protein